MEKCYICLEDTPIMIHSEVCECHIYSHIECYEEWIKTNGRCLICKCAIPFNDEKTYITMFIMKLINFVQPFANYLIECQQHWLGFLIFLFLSFIITILLVIPLYFISAISLTRSRFTYRTVNLATKV